MYGLDYSSQDEDLVYIVKANTNPDRYPGDGPIRGRDFVMSYVFYIREKDFAILRIDYGAGEYSRRLEPEGVPAHLRLEATEDGILVFQASPNGSFLHYYQVVVGYAWHERQTGKLIARGVERNEAIIQEKSNTNQKNFPLIRGRNNSIPVIEYDASFWDHYPLSDQIPLDPQVIKDLERHAVSIEDQFKGNSQEWWSPQTLKETYKRLRTEPPELSLTGNVSVELPGFTEAKHVSVAGDFNKWNPVQYFLEKNESGWSGKLKLPPGTYSYKFVVDGEWVCPGTDNKDGESADKIVVTP